MATLRNVLIILYCFAFSSIAEVTGKVTDGEGDAIAGAILYILSDPNIIDTTDDDGSFSIATPTATNWNYYTRTPAVISGLCIKRKQLRFVTTSGIKNGVVSIFSSKGRRCSLMPLGKMNAGPHHCLLPDLRSGFYIVKISSGPISATCRVLSTGSSYFLTAIDSDVPGLSRGNRISAQENTDSDSLFIQKKGFKPMKEFLPSYRQTDMTIIMDRTKSKPIDVNAMPEIEEMPDPLTMNNGDKVTTLEQWRIRRKEMIRILEDYEYGHMPPPPGNVKASVKTPSTRISASGGKNADYRKIHLTFGPEEKCGFDLVIFVPVIESVKKHPVLIYVGFGGLSQSSLSQASPAFSRDYAVVVVNYSDLGADSPNWQSSAFFPHYPEYDWRDFSAWAWGISRVVDYLVTDSLIDSEKIMATGVSRCGQPVLVAGAFDERIALSAPVGGGMSFRFSGREMGNGIGQGITEIVDQGTYWFGPLLEKFRNKTPRLPCDQHWLAALTAPRLFILCNAYRDEYGRAYAAVQTYLGAEPVYDLLDAHDNLGMHFREGGHGITGEDWNALLDFADQYLLKKAGTRKFDVVPPKEKTP